MSKSKKNTKKTYRLYILFEEGKWMQPEIIKCLVEHVTRDAELEDFGTGNAYNMPIYLLGVLENHEDNAIVVAWDWDEDKPHPRFLVEPSEICPLIEALEANPDGDSWEIAVAVNKEIRATQKSNNGE